MASLKCWEIMCFVYSIILFASGLILIAFSSVLTYNVLRNFSFIPGNVLTPFILLFILGIGHLFLPWLGINGPRREHNFHIIFFMAIAALLLIVEIAVGIWCVMLRDEVAIESVELMTKSFKVDDIKIGKNKSWNRIQSELKCCGLYGSIDYGTVCPLSCIDHELTSSGVIICYEESCKKPFTKYAKNILLKGAAIAFLTGVYQGVGLIVFWFYFKLLRKTRAERLARRTEIQRQASSDGQHQSVAAPLMQNPPQSGTTHNTQAPNAPAPPTTTTS